MSLLMRTYLISYDLGVPETSSEYKRVIEYIQSLGTWATPLKSQWFVKSNKSTAQIRDDIMSLTDTNDLIMVLDVTDDDWGTARIDEVVTHWMRVNI